MIRSAVAGPLLLASLLSAVAQEPAPVRIAGRVVTGPDSVPVQGLEVSLHEVTPDGGDVVARDTTDLEGRFGFSHGVEGDRSSSVYLITARYREVPYVGRALHSLSGAVEDYVLAVHPTRPAAEITLTSRRTMVSPADGGVDVVEILELANASDSTLVPAGRGVLGWELRLPPGASELQPLATSLTEAGGGVRALGESLLISGGIHPGGRRVAVRYRVRNAEIAVPVRGPATRHEVLVHPSLRGTVTGLSPAEAVSFEGVSYRRWVGAGLESGATVRVEVRAGGPSTRDWLPWLFLAIGGLAMAGALWAWRTAEPGS